MKQTIEYDIGSKVTCSDGVCGHLTRVVVDPIARSITHVVVEAGYRHGTGHLVPIDLLSSSAGKAIQLRCTTAEFEALEDAKETHFLPGAGDRWDYEPGQMLSWPYYGHGSGMLGLGIAGDMGMDVGGSLGTVGMRTGPRTVTNDRVPTGEVEVRRGDHVHASDGAIGRVQGLVIDPSDYHVTHVLLDEGHLWGKKRVAIPIRAVTRIDDDVRLNLTRDEVGNLPSVDLDDSEPASSTGGLT
jgi:sporulation protein YlmC with PRC-barrel domain